MKKVVIISIAMISLMTTNFVSADNIRGINIEFVTIGNLGNVADPYTGSLYGSVDYNYRIGKYEVTNAQWDAFVASAGIPMGSDGGYSYSTVFLGDQKPTGCVSWYEAIQFCNYLTSGDKSKGAYIFSGNNTNPGSFLGINRTTAQATYGTIYVLPTEDEWYKAAYFKPDGSGYSLYANGTDIAPSIIQTRYNHVEPWNVGKGVQEQNGTYDMMGNFWEWNEAVIGLYRCDRGGSYTSSSPDRLSPTYRVVNGLPYEELSNMGFRIASIPEPSSILLFGFIAIFLRRQ